MPSNNKFIGLIPARKGSKGLINKNMLDLSCKPLVQHTIEAASEASRIDDVWVSSDDSLILNLAKSLHVNQLQRPAEYASDNSSAVDVVNHYISEISTKTYSCDDFIVYLQPTSPLRNSTHIDSAIQMLIDSKMNSLVSVALLRKSPFKSFVINKSGELESLFDEQLSNSRRQDLKKAYIPNGAIYIFKINEFIKRGGFPSNASIPFIMSDDDSIDIDEIEDLNKAQNILRKKNA